MSPRSSHQFEEIRNKSVQNIATAAIALFSKQGYQNVTVSQIARQAGVSKGLMYNYFKSKEALLWHVIENMLTEMRDTVQVIEDESEPLVKVEKIIRLTFQVLRSKKEFWASIMPILTQHAVSEVAEKKLKTFFITFIDIMENLFQEIGLSNARMEAYKLGALIDGIALDYIFLFKEKYPLEEMEQLIIEQYQILKTDK